MIGEYAGNTGKEFDMRLSTRDIGLALRDVFEGQTVPQYTSDAETETDTGYSGRIIFVDVADANNPVFHLENGQNFTVRIIAT